MFCSMLAERGVKNTAGSSMGVGRVLTCFTPEPQACREGSEKHCWRFGVAGSQWGADRFIYVRRLFFFCLSSTRHRKMVQNPQATEKERSGCKTKHCWGLGGVGSVPPSKSGPEPPLSKLTHMIISCGDLRLVGSTHHRKVVQT